MPRRGQPPKEVEGIARHFLPDRLLDFDHAYCEAPIGEIARRLWQIEEALLARGRTVFDFVSREAVVPDFRDMYLHPIRANATLLWIWPSMTESLALLSKAMRKPVTYVSWTGHMRMCEFLRFEDGTPTVELIDPETPLRTNTWTTADLGGHGRRRFKDLHAFLESIGKWYRPNDQTWQYGKWHFEEWRAATLATPECRIRWSLKLDVAQKLVQPVGHFSQPEMESISRSIMSG